MKKEGERTNKGISKRALLFSRFKRLSKKWGKEPRAANNQSGGDFLSCLLFFRFRRKAIERGTPQSLSRDDDDGLSASSSSNGSSISSC